TGRAWELRRGGGARVAGVMRLCAGPASASCQPTKYRAAPPPRRDESAENRDEETNPAGQAQLALGHTGVRRDPVHFPCLAFIGRERLLEPARRRRDIGDDEPDQDRAPVQRLVVV